MRARKPVQKISVILIWLVSMVVFALLFLTTGCAVLETRSAPSPIEESVGSWTLETYRQFLTDNQKHLNHMYSNEYEDYLFLVDTDKGTRPIQDLIDPESVRWLWRGIGREALTDSEKVLLCYKFIINRFTYVPNPNNWPFPEQTLKSREGDCKGLSLILISLLLTAKMDCYAAINHGHMWVNVKVNGKWQTLETDADPERNVIYNSPGFYATPLFKISQHKALKRVRKKEHELG